MAAALTLADAGGDFYGALLACVQAAERDFYAELPLLPATERDFCNLVAELRGFAFRVRFAFRATAVAIETLHLRNCCDGWPVEQVALDPPPASIVLVAQRRQGLIGIFQPDRMSWRSGRSFSAAAER